ncbi:MAG: hypothetical protein RLZZ77_2365 [Bacteroidota bacterium]|jgi:1,4-alpha-glucan branching enzyme
MKKISLLAVFSLWSLFLLAVPYNVTFRVDMNNYPGTFTTPEVNGTFNGWCGNCIPMTDVNGDNIWEVTFPLAPGSYEYKFSHDNWAGQENLSQAGSCAPNNGGYFNRTLSVTQDIVLDAVCWGSCVACSQSIPNYNVTFKVDMSQYPGTYTTPEVNGTFNGWCGNCNPMTDVNGDDIWEVTLALPQGSYEYKFSHDSWTGQESLSQAGSCAPNNNGFFNRTLSLTQNTVLDAVCWGSCVSCSQTLPNYNVTFKLDMRSYTGNYTTPEVNGTFNGWCGNCNQMSDANGDEIWELTLSLPQGNYEYKYSADNWTSQEQLAGVTGCTVLNNGFTNRALNLTQNTVLAPVCWGSCSACYYDVTFKVDMSLYSGTFTTPEVNGTFNGWCGNCNAMTDANGDDIWEVTLPLAPGNYEYKFSHDSWTGQEQLASAGSCAPNNNGFFNRVLSVSQNTVLDPICWGSCVVCSQSTPSYNVTFKVDMNQYTGNFTTPEVNGTFNNWCGNCTPMTDVNGDNIWEVTVNLPQGNYEYKFSHDFWTGQENLTTAGSCTVTNNGFTNRSLSLTQNTVLDAVCWGYCVPCSQVQPPRTVTFKVDMSHYTGNYTTPEVNGTFNGWCGNCNAMSDANGDDIWEVTLTLPQGNYEYKFSHDFWTGQENLTAGSSCTVTNGAFTNRTLNLTQNVVLDPVCWGYCLSCNVIPQNDTRSAARSVNATTYPSCFNNNLSTDLTNATASSESTISSASGAGQDVWFKFVASTPGARISSSSAFDVALELQTAAGASLAIENDAQGNEVLIYGNLTIGQTYYVVLRNQSTSSIGSASICIQKLGSSNCNNVSNNFASLCTSFKVAYTGASSYSLSFTEVPTAGDVTSDTFNFTTPNGGTVVSFNNIPGLNYGRSYNVVISANYVLTDGSGNVTTVTIPSNGCLISFGAQPELDLRANDASPNLRYAGSQIGANRWICGASYYRWAITQTAPITGLTTYTDGLPNNRFLSLIAVNQQNPGTIVPGGQYTVQVAPVFGNIVGNFGSVDQTLIIAGSAMPIIDESENLTTRIELEDAPIAAVYPNPSNGQLVNINATGLVSSSVEVRVIDAQGRMVTSQRFAVNETLNQMVQFDELLSDGLYLVEILDGDTTYTERFIVQK